VNILEITIQRGSGDAWPVAAEHSTSGAFLPVRSEGVLQIDLAELRAQVDPRGYGTLLGRALFRDEVRDAFVRARAESDGTLRLLLFVEADDLKTLRWERLCAPLDAGWDFLALDQRVPFSLYLPSLTDRRFPPIGRRDLRALVMVAGPEGLEKYRLESFDPEIAVSSVQTALGEIPCDVLAAVEGAVGPPTLDALCERITAERYTLLHVVCHGRYKRGGEETVLYLADADNQVDPVPGTRLLERLGRLSGVRGLPHLAFLATCESASPEAEGALGGLAQQLVRDLGMPAVVAMTDRVSVATAQALAEAFYRRLREHGEVDRALVEACAGLAERHDITVPALYSRLGGRPLFSDTLDRPLTNAEIAYGLSRVEALLPQRAPVLQPAFEKPAATLRGTVEADPSALSEPTRQEREAALTELNNLCQEALDLSFNALALGQEPPAYDHRCPFRGLYPFRVEDREFFFGREALVDLLRENLDQHNPSTGSGHRFLAVLGPSGSGKSSVVLAGLVPALQAEEPGLQMAYLTPGSDPLAHLEASLSKVGDRPAVLVVDQFEELFTLCADEDKRRAFLDRLLAPDLSGFGNLTALVITMRADFWGECAPFNALKQEMLAHQELIAPMNSGELRRAMEMQAARVGLRFEADLGNTILDDVQGEPGAMPLLQHALLELWKRRHGRWLRAGEYRAIGGVRQAIARTADEVYAGLSPDEQERVRDIFVRLTRLDEEAVRGEERRDTRRRVGLEELVPAGSAPVATKALVKRLADARLVVTGVNEVTGREEVEVAHEALIRHWPRLRGWLDEDRAGYRLRQGISRAAQEWEAGGEDESLLVHRGGRLEDAEALAQQPKFALNKQEQAYLDACVALREREKAEQERRRQREMWGLRLLAGLGLVAIIAAVLAFVQLGVATRERDRANREADARATEVVVRSTAEADALGAQATAEAERDRADKQARIALARQLAAQTITSIEREGDAVLHLLLAVEASRITNDAGLPYVQEADDALRQALGTAPLANLHLHHRGASVNRIVFSPKGALLAIASADGTAHLVNTRTGEEIAALNHARIVTDVAFSPSGGQIATASKDGAVRVWDIKTKTQQAILHYQDSVQSVVFSPDGLRIAVATDANIMSDAMIHLWDTTTWAKLAVLPHKDRVLEVIFSSDGKRLASRSSDNTVRLWDVESGERLTLLRHGGWITDFAFSSDGAYLATASQDGTARLLDAVTGEELGVLHHKETVAAVDFSPDGTRLATASTDGTARVWDTATREMLTELPHPTQVWDVAFSPIGAGLATGSPYYTTRLWDADTGVQRIVLRPEGLGRVPFLGTIREGVITTPISVRFLPDGKRLITRSLDAVFRIWDTATGVQLKVLRHASGANAIAVRPDGAQVATVGEDNTVRLWNVVGGVEPLVFQHDDRVHAIAFSPEKAQRFATVSNDAVHLVDTAEGAEVAILRHEGPISALAFSPDGTKLATASDDRTARLWDAVTGTQLAVLRHKDLVNDVVFSPNGAQLATASDDGTVCLWNVSTGGRSAVLPHKGSVDDVSFSPDGTRLATTSADNTVRLWDAIAGTELRQVSHTGEARAVFSPQGAYLASFGLTDKNVYLVNARTGSDVAVLSHGAGVDRVVFSPDGTRLATVSEDDTVHLVDATSGIQLAVLHHKSMVQDVGFNPDGQQLVTASTDGTALLVDAATGEQLAILRHHDGVNEIAFSPNGQKIATASEDGHAYLWSAATGKILAVLPHGASVNRITFSPDGTQLGTASRDGTARLWEVSTGSELAILRHNEDVWDIGFSPDGHWLVTQSGDHAVRLWRTRVEDMVQIACHVAGRNLTKQEWAQYLGNRPYHKTCPNLPGPEEAGTQDVKPID
jgi:WD40 repeat protein